MVKPVKPEPHSQTKTKHRVYTHGLYTHGVYAYCAHAWNVGEKPWYDKSDITGSVMQK